MPPIEPDEESPLAARVVVCVWVCCWGVGLGVASASGWVAALSCEVVVCAKVGMNEKSSMQTRKISAANQRSREGEKKQESLQNDETLFFIFMAAPPEMLVYNTESLWRAPNRRCAGSRSEMKRVLVTCQRIVS
jgi:hypothetical protein